MKPTLLILAAGIARRYGSMKQVDTFGPNGETIMEYAIYDAMRSGFGKVVFVIRETHADTFKALFQHRLPKHIVRDYVYQSDDLSVYGIDKKIARLKPWGTGHAMLAARNQIHEPFCVINADDFYGYDAFKKMALFLTTAITDHQYALVSYLLNSTLSPYGSVSRGVCSVDTNGNMTAIHERIHIYKKDHSIVFKENNIEHTLPDKSPVSMTFWGFTPAIFKQSEALFRHFIHANASNPKAEFVIPLIVDALIKTGQVSFKAIPTNTKWFGVTYKEDKESTQKNISELVQNGVYPEKLWP